MTPAVHFEKCPSQAEYSPKKVFSEASAVRISSGSLSALGLWIHKLLQAAGAKVHQGQMQGQVCVGKSLLWQQGADMEK